jgi:hypothetical protein
MKSDEKKKQNAKDSIANGTENVCEISQNRCRGKSLRKLSTFAQRRTQTETIKN